MTPVITGLGITAPTGLGVEAYWTATLAGKSGLGRITRFDPDVYPATLAGEIHDFDPAEHLPGKLLPQTDLMTQLALAAADWAFEDAGIVPEQADSLRTGVVTASSTGGFEFGQRVMQSMWSRGNKHVSAYQSYAWFYAVNSGQISIRNGLRGACGVVVSDAAGGLDALGQARRQLRRDCSAVLAGGVDSSICSFGLVSQLATGRLSTGDDPDRAYLPFDDRAAGHVFGEGGALLVMETPENALARGAHQVYGHLAGYAATMDPRPGSGREPALRRAVELALDDAEVSPTEVDVVFADAAGVPELDAIEAQVISDVFGAGQVPVTAPKTATGRLNAGGGSLDVATALLSIRDGVVPPTPHVERSPRYDIELVTGSPMVARLRTAVVLARGIGGFNSAVVVRGGLPTR
ncbi:ketosynthase chain-length factor [Lentzea sp. NBRC 102530]|uniref:ketosynthase chain-length factor n=1 Tax=Lentzea sp. NBRC 102530 TaxID=3032201 RepID=UPI0024A1A9C2|nr:ketosynthase chain-length factor [Lentzea sp. NBRC 102530]GLY46846.1 actinorhodin polyketide putative beta-ketoacyl synthase 2 [Lentzea sp. NBRC 102530]